MSPAARRAPLVKDLTVGWHAIDHGDPPRSMLLDSPPAPTVTDLAEAHRAWRLQVEHDEAQLAQAHASQPTWRPVALPSDIFFLPVFGGSTRTREHLMTMLVTSALESGSSRVRVVNLLGSDMSGELRTTMQRARRNSARFERVSASGSTVDLLSRLSRDALIALIADVRRVESGKAAGMQSARAAQVLTKIAKQLDEPMSLTKLHEAVDFTLTGAPWSPTSLSATERRALQDFRDTVVTKQPTIMTQLGELEADLGSLTRFTRRRASAPDTVGAGPETVRCYQVDVSGSTGDVDLARELVSRAVMHAIGGTPNECTVVVGAELLADEVVDAMRDRAAQTGAVLALLFSSLTGKGKQILSANDTPLVVLAKLSDSDGANAAADHIGREYKFVINGVSIAEGQTQEWNTSFGTTSSTSRSTSTSRTKNSGFGGKALSFGRSFGTTVSQSFDQGSSHTTGQGGSTSSTRTVSSGRVQEHIVEPTVFQHLEDDMVFVVTRETLMLVSCDGGLRRAPGTYSQQMAIP